MSAGEFERLMPGGQYLDKATQLARDCEAPGQPAWMRDYNREAAQRWRDHRWAMWDSGTKWNQRGQS